jgi:tetratricopeptide (TPR) repeat protein
VYDNLRSTVGEEHQKTLNSLTNLGAILLGQRKYREAEPLLRRALALNQKLFGDTHNNVANSWGNQGGLLLEKGDLAGAERAYRQARLSPSAYDQSGDPPARPHLIAQRLHDLGRVLTARGRAAETEPLLGEALAIRTEKLEPGDRLTGKTRLRLVSASRGWDDCRRSKR